MSTNQCTSTCILVMYSHFANDCIIYIVIIHRVSVVRLSICCKEIKIVIQLLMGWNKAIVLMIPVQSRESSCVLYGCAFSILTDGYVPYNRTISFM